VRGSPVIGERIIPEEFKVARQQYLLYLRHVFAYDFAIKMIPRESTVLEVGCGGGYGTYLLSQKVGKVIGLDIDKSAIAYVTEKYGSENCVFSTYDGTKIPYAEETFNAVLSFQVIEHVEDDLNYVARIFSVLKPGGIFLLTTPNKTYRLKPGQKPWNRYHKREYYPDELAELLRHKFPDVCVWGIRGNEEVQNLELEKMKHRSSVVSFFRRMVPEWLKLVMIKFWQRLSGLGAGGKNKEFLNKYSIKDFYVIKDNVEESLDLLAVCRK